MTWLLEDSSTILWVGGIIELILAAVLVITRRMIWIVPMAVVLLLVGAAVTIERWVVTPREQVLMRLETAAQAVEANDLDAVMVSISPKGQITRSDVALAFSDFRFEEVELREIEVTIDKRANPPMATAKFIAIATGKPRRDGVASTRHLARLHVTLHKVGNDWLVDSFVLEGVPRL